MANIPAEIQQSFEEVGDKVVNFEFLQAWRVWIDAVHRLHRRNRRLENVEPLPQPPWKLKVWACIVLILMAVVTFTVLVGCITKEAVTEDLSLDGRFREIHAIPRFMRNITYVLSGLNVYFRRFVN